MKTMFLLSIILLGTALAQDKLAGVTKIPSIPEDYATKFKTLVIRQQKLQMDENRLAQAFQKDQEALTQVNAEGQKLESAMLTKLNLSPDKYTTETLDTGEIVIVEKPAK